VLTNCCGDIMRYIAAKTMHTTAMQSVRCQSNEGNSCVTLTLLCRSTDHVCEIEIMYTVCFVFWQLRIWWLR